MAEPLLIAGPKRMAEQTWVRAFIRLAGALLLVMALVHLLNAGAYGERLLVFDPLLGIPSRLALLLVAGLELAVALFCFFGGPPGLQAALVAWLAANFRRLSGVREATAGALVSSTRDTPGN